MKVNLTPVHEQKYSQIMNYNFAFGLCVPDGDGLRLLTTSFNCKDYLQDIFWSENTKKKDSCCGLNWEPGRVDLRAEHQYLLIHSTPQTAEENLLQQRDSLEAFLRQFDEAQGWGKTWVHPVQDMTGKEMKNALIIQAPKGWFENGPLISSLTSLIRLARTYRTGPADDFLKKILPDTSKDNWSYSLPNDYSGKEIMRAPSTVPKLRALLRGKKPNHPWATQPLMGSAHSGGVMGCQTYPKID